MEHITTRFDGTAERQELKKLNIPRQDDESNHSGWDEDQKIEALFPTARKCKLPRGLSYPVGTEILSRAFARVPQSEELVLDFLCGIRRESTTMYCMCVEYNPNGIGFTLQNKWGLTIYSVPSELKATVRRVLEEDGFAHIQEWLTQPHPPSWFEAWKRLIIEFVSEGETLLYSEEGRL